MAIIAMVDISAAFTAIKETLGLLKVVNDAKSDFEIKAATSEIQSKLITLQSECFTLGDMVRAHEAEVVALKTKIAEIENFERKAEDYTLEKLTSGTLIYSKKLTMDQGEVTVNACPQCFHNKKISILQPGIAIQTKSGFFVHYCPECKSDFKMNRLPPQQPIQVAGYRSGGGW